MAKQVITLLTDDLDGSEADRTVEFGLDGVTYTIDLSDRNIGKLRKVLDPYLAVGTRVRRNGREAPTATRNQPPAATPVSARETNKSIREWAAENGYELAARGRIPIDVVKAYQQRH